MPAIGMRVDLARTRGIRLVGLALALLFVASIGTAWSAPAEARNWTPQIQTTRRAQIHWETVMRQADAEIRRLQKTKVQTQRTLRSVRAGAEVAVRRRALEKRELKDAKTELTQARAALNAAQQPTPPLPAAEDALATLADTPPLLPPGPAAAQDAPERDDETGGATTDAPVTAVAPADKQAMRQLEREAKQAKRDFKQAKRRAKRSLRSARVLQNRLHSIQVATRQATARREVAERSLGAWILAMTKYGRIRATKKSDARPGVNSSFAWPVRGRISQTYHARHDGIDIVRYQGAPVRSMAFGVVTYVGWNPWDQHGRAFMVVVTHAGGYETLYGHLQPKRTVRVGEEVRKGQVIGYMGNTGNSTGPHLHLELRRGRTTLNPLGVL